MKRDGKKGGLEIVIVFENVAHVVPVSLKGLLPCDIFVIPPSDSLWTPLKKYNLLVHGPAQIVPHNPTKIFAAPSMYTLNFTNLHDSLKNN